MSEFTIHTIDSAPTGSKEMLVGVKKRFGFVPNLLGELAAAPAALNAYLALNEFLSQTSLSPVAQQLVLASTSVANGCEYCVAAHSAGLKAAGFPDGELDALRKGQPLQDDKLEALRMFVKSIVEHRGWVKQPALQRFLSSGYRREQVFEVLVGVAMKTLSNYASHTVDTPLDRELEPFAWESVTA